VSRSERNVELEPEVEEYLRSLPTPTDSFFKIGVGAARKFSRDAEAQYAWDSGVKAEVREDSVPVEGGSIPVRIYTPPGAPAGSKLPLLVYLHGGGWVLGWLDSLDLDALCTYLCTKANCVVVSVGYRLSPENKFPGPVEDSYAGLQWASKNAASLGADADNLAVAGESAGGNLAAVICLVARDRGGPFIKFQMLIVPVTDRKMDSESYSLYAKGYSLDRDDMLWFWTQYLRTEEEGAHPYASPLRASDLRGLPPAFVMTAGIDPLRDEGEAYAERLKKSGVKVRLHRAEGKPHGILSLPFGTRERELAVTELRRVFSGAADVG
jgi:acetyl esterase